MERSSRLAFFPSDDSFQHYNFEKMIGKTIIRKGFRPPLMGKVSRNCFGAICMKENYRNKTKIRSDGKITAAKIVQ